MTQRLNIVPVCIYADSRRRRHRCRWFSVVIASRRGSCIFCFKLNESRLANAVRIETDFWANAWLCTTVPSMKSKQTGMMCRCETNANCKLLPNIARFVHLSRLCVYIKWKKLKNRPKEIRRHRVFVERNQQIHTQIHDAIRHLVVAARSAHFTLAIEFPASRARKNLFTFLSSTARTRREFAYGLFRLLWTRSNRNGIFHRLLLFRMHISST